MTRIAKLLLAVLIALAAFAPLHSVHARAPYTQAELDQMLAPIALYPDALLSQILLAATRPLEVVEAARWSRANPWLQGDDAVRAAQLEDWDPSVKSLVAFPQLLARMDERLEWTEALGDAFFVQEPVVMETIQELRRRARAAGHLLADERLRVYEDSQAIVIEPATPQLVHIPYYDPWVVYGPWWWSAYPPVAWAPWPGYTVVRRQGVPAGLWWGPGIGVSIGFMLGSVDWFHRRVRVSEHAGHSRPLIHQRDPQPQRRIVPVPAAPAPRFEPRAPRADRPDPRRDTRLNVTSPEPRRLEPRAGTAVDPGARFTQRAPETRRPATTTPVAPRQVERVPRMEARRAERVPQTPAPQSPPQRSEGVQQSQSPASQPAQSQPRRIQPPQVQPQRTEAAPKAMPKHTERSAQREAREAREELRRGGIRP